MAHHVDDFSRGVGICYKALISQITQLAECQDEFAENVFRHVRPIIPQHIHLRLDVGVVDGMGAEYVPWWVIDVLYYLK